MQIVLDTRGMQMSVRNHCFLFSSGERTNIVHPERISSIVVTAPCRISSPAILLAAENQIPLVICNPCGQPQARLWSSQFFNTSSLRRKQYQFTISVYGVSWAETIIKLKINEQLENLKYFFTETQSTTDGSKILKEMMRYTEVNYTANEKNTIDAKKKILFMEAYAASQYWQNMGKELPEPFKFTNRIKRKPSDPFNAMINYLYGMLRNEVETAVLSIGLDPALGVMHRDGYRMASLIFDLMEPFRPFMDKILWTTVKLGQFPADGFQLEPDAPCQITKTGRKYLMQLFTATLHSKTKYRQSNNTLRNHILTETKRLSDLIKQL